MNIVDEFGRRPGSKRFEAPLVPTAGALRWAAAGKGLAVVEPMWRVEADEEFGSVSFEGHDSLEEALASVPARQAEPENARYTNWVIVKYQPTMVQTIAKRLPPPVTKERT